MATGDDVSQVIVLYDMEHNDEANVSQSLALYEYQRDFARSNVGQAIVLYEYQAATPTAEVPNESGTIGQEQVLSADNPNTDGNKYRWSWTAVPAGSTVTNTQTAFPDGGVNTTFDMTDNEGLYHTDALTGGTTFEDTSGNNNDITKSGTVTVGTGKIAGQGSAVFGSATDILSLGSSVPTNNADWSVAFWFKGIRPITQWRSAVSGSAQHQLILELNSNRLGMFDSSFIDSGAELDPADYTDWNHIAVVSAGEKKTFYINGLQVGALRANFTAPIETINNSAGQSFLFADEVSEIAIWSRPLTDEEVFKVNTQQSGDYAGDEITLTYTPDKVGTYEAQFDSAYGNTIASATAETFITAGTGFIGSFGVSFYDGSNFYDPPQ